MHPVRLPGLSKSLLGSRKLCGVSDNCIPQVNYFLSLRPVRYSHLSGGSCVIFENYPRGIVGIRIPPWEQSGGRARKLGGRRSSERVPRLNFGLTSLNTSRSQGQGKQITQRPVLWLRGNQEPWEVTSPGIRFLTQPWRSLHVTQITQISQTL